MTKIQVFKETTDWWAPSYEMRGKWYVRIFIVTLSSGKTRVGVWGADDYGMEYDFQAEADARQTFWYLIEQPTITEFLVKQLGFVRG